MTGRPAQAVERRLVSINCLQKPRLLPGEAEGQSRVTWKVRTKWAERLGKKDFHVVFWMLLLTIFLLSDVCVCGIMTLVALDAKVPYKSSNNCFVIGKSLTAQKDYYTQAMPLTGR